MPPSNRTLRFITNLGSETSDFFYPPSTGSRRLRSSASLHMASVSYFRTQGRCSSLSMERRHPLTSVTHSTSERSDFFDSELNAVSFQPLLFVFIPVHSWFRNFWFPNPLVIPAIPANSTSVTLARLRREERKSQRLASTHKIRRKYLISSTFFASNARQHGNLSHTISAKIARDFHNFLRFPLSTFHRTSVSRFLLATNHLPLTTCH